MSERAPRLGPPCCLTRGPAGRWPRSLTALALVWCRQLQDGAGVAGSDEGGGDQAVCLGPMEQVDDGVAERDDGRVGVLVDDGPIEHVLIPRPRAFDVVDEQVIAPMMLAVGITFSWSTGRPDNRSQRTTLCTAEPQAEGPASATADLWIVYEVFANS